MSRSRHEQILRQALEMAVAPQPRGAAWDSFTADVVGSFPNFVVTSRSELYDAVVDLDEGMSNLEIDISAFGCADDRAVAEWHLQGDHTGQLSLGEGEVIQATGRHLELSGVTVAEFRGGRICAFRNYFDDATVLEQLLLPR